MRRFIKDHLFSIQIGLTLLFAALFTFGFADKAQAALGVMPFLFGVEREAGMPDYETGTGTKEIPWIFSRKSVAKFYDKSVAPFTSMTDYEGEITKEGSKIIIDTIPTVVIRAYKKGGGVNWQTLSSPAVELTINRAAYFAFKFDKIDLKQFALNKMDQCSNDAAEQMKIYMDEEYLGDIYADASTQNKGTTAGKKSGLYNIGTTASSIPLTKANIVDYIMMCEAVGNEQSWPDSDRWMVTPTWAKFLIDTSELKDASLTGNDKSNLVSGGRFGKIGKFTLYESNLYTAVSDTGNSCYNICFGHRSGIAFATQLTETEFHEKFENTFGSGMKGLKVYDWEVIKPTSLGVLYGHKG